MKKLFQVSTNQYPRQFWFLFWGMLISTAGASMIWPFLMIYVSERLGLAMTATASLMTINAATALLASFAAGPIADRTGRKGTMVVGLIATGLSYLAMIPANSLMAFAVLMGLRGLARPLFRVGSDAMIADLIPEGKRADAYALSRLSKNVGVALGPALGGFAATSSYSIAFITAAVTLILFGIMIALFLNESLQRENVESIDHIKPQNRGYRHLVGDRGFLNFIGAFTLTQISATIIWVLLGVYAKDNFQILENQFGFIPMTNAVMVVILQVWVTRNTQRKAPLWMLFSGALIYALGVGSIALGTGFWGFWGSMVIVTIGELILIPTATTYVANLAPPDMRGRYMSAFTFSWGVGSGIGPVVGGYLNDQINPQAIWYGGGLIGILGALWFFVQAGARKEKPRFS
jgi:MFS family permease